MRCGLMDYQAEHHRLTSLLKNEIEVVSAEQDFMRYTLEFLLKAIIIGMVSKSRKNIEDLKNHILGVWYFNLIIRPVVFLFH